MNKLKYIVVDVDGTMTDGGIYYDENGNEWKKFCTRDAAGFFIADFAGIQIIVLTGRQCEATNRRMKELRIRYFYQGIQDKFDFLQRFIHEKGISSGELGYIGDDLNDLAAMKLADYVGCPADACYEVRQVAQYISNQKGGSGAVRDVIEHILKERGEWETAVANLYENSKAIL